MVAEQRGMRPQLQLETGVAFRTKCDEFALVDEAVGAYWQDWLGRAMRYERRRSAPMNVSSKEFTLRAVDVAMSLSLLAFFMPLLLVIALAVWISDPGPVFFVHQRVGKGGRRFGCLKFRTMVRDAEARLSELFANDPIAKAQWDRDHKLENDPRIVGIGNFLRKSSLDELPQLLNVLTGKMSIVGPRPIVDAEVIRYGRYFVHYCSVRPGLTGLWQVSGRNNVSYRRRVAIDSIFAQSHSIGLYFKVLVMTVPVVLFGKGAR